MDQGDLLVLALIILAFAVFAVLLAYYSSRS